MPTCELQRPSAAAAIAERTSVTPNACRDDLARAYERAGAGVLSTST
jgi:hypothetical protein